MKRLFTICSLLLHTSHLLANSAMPGIWQTGANGRFLPLFEKDSVYYGKIKMQREQILVNLYPGFAVVKGEYWMYNTTSTTIDMHVGYPKQGIFDAAVVKHVMPTYISALQVKVNELPTTLMQPTDSGYAELNSSKRVGMQDKYDSWFLWQMKFAPKAVTKITVYFITDNSNAKVSQGYSKRSGNAFTYVLESGRAWSGIIDSGRICIQLKNGLTANDITGVLPDSTVFAADDRMLYAFINKEPMPRDNLLLFYKDSPASFDFKQQVLPDAESYFKEIDNFSTATFIQSNMQLVHKLDMLPNDSGIGFFGWLSIGILVGAALVIALIIRFIIAATKASQQAGR